MKSISRVEQDRFHYSSLCSLVRYPGQHIISYGDTIYAEWRLEKLQLSIAIAELETTKTQTTIPSMPISFIDENNAVDFQFDNCCGSEVHSYNTRYKDHLRLPAINTHWGQLRTNYHFIKDWNILPESVTNAETKTSFKSEYWNLSL